MSQYVPFLSQQVSTSPETLSHLVARRGDLGTSGSFLMAHKEISALRAALHRSTYEISSLELGTVEHQLDSSILRLLRLQEQNPDSDLSYALLKQLSAYHALSLRRQHRSFLRPQRANANKRHIIVPVPLCAKLRAEGVKWYTSMLYAGAATFIWSFPTDNVKMLNLAAEMRSRFAELELRHGIAPVHFFQPQSPVPTLTATRDILLQLLRTYMDVWLLDASWEEITTQLSGCITRFRQGNTGHIWQVSQ